MTYPDIFHISRYNRSAVSRAAARGDLQRVGRGVYTSLTDRDPATLIHARWPEVVAAVFPGALISHRTALEGRPAHDGTVFVTVPTNRSKLSDQHFTGFTVRPIPGPAPTDTDMSLGGEISISSRARACLENLTPSRARKTISRTVGREGVEAYLDKLLRTSQDGRRELNRIRDEARHIAEGLGLTEEAKTLDETIGALLGTRDADVKSAVGRARKRGRGYDPERANLFTRMQEFLSSVAPSPLPAPDLTQSDRTNLAFFEAYFSNFIEGTEFEVDEAHDVVFSGIEPQERPEDAHDIRGTFSVVSSDSDMQTIPHSADELTDLLLRRHATIMEARPSVGPGCFKTRRNKAGGTTFVEPDLVEGTLEKGFECWRRLSDPFARAVMAMFVVSEVHPFADGNGRVARIMMNAELEAAGQSRIMIPIVYRNNYLQALKAASRGDSFEALQRTLAFGQRWVHATFTSDVTHDLNSLRAVIEATNAFRDPTEADIEGVRLRLPTPEDFDNAVPPVPGGGSVRG